MDVEPAAVAEFFRSRCNALIGRAPDNPLKNFTVHLEVMEDGRLFSTKVCDLFPTTFDVDGVPTSGRLLLSYGRVLLSVTPEELAADCAADALVNPSFPEIGL